MSAFSAALEHDSGVEFDSYAQLHEFSTAHYRKFWEFFVRWCPELGLTGSTEPVCVGDECETAVFFPHMELNYADSLLNLSVAPADATALVACRVDGTSTRSTRGELRQRVAAVADALQRIGVGPGDRVVALLRNDGNAVIAALAVAAVGATFSSASPEMGEQAILDRFAALEPRVLIANVAAQPFDSGTPLAAKVHSLLQQLQSVRLVVHTDGDGLGATPGFAGTLRDRPWLIQRSLDQLREMGNEINFDWPRFGFNHPLFIMFSSGTTGRPKCIIHGAGGTLIEHVKEHRLHTALSPSDRLYFHTSCSWMMWNWQLSALASGVQVVTYDGPVSTVDRLWRLVADQRVTVFGTSPSYLKMSEQAGLTPMRELNLGSLRAILSTGAVLYDSQFEWVRRNVKDVPMQSISGGTDIIGCFVLGHPDLPVRPGEAQCRSLGMDVQAWLDGSPSVGRIGQLVCTNPFPSRPIGFFGNEGGARFHRAYFAANPGVWTHGDLIEFSAEGSARLHGRCDGVLNVRGIKVAPGEIYRSLADIPEIRESMVVQTGPTPSDAEPLVIALLVLREGTTLDGKLVARVRRHIASHLSAAHVPDRIIDVAELPITHSGKFSEAAARAALNGTALENESALRNPECLGAIRDHPGLRDAQGDARPEDLDLDHQLLSLWRRVLCMDGIGLEDNFFELGGNSLLGARLLREVETLAHTVLPLAVLFEAPTIKAMSVLLRQGVARPADQVLIRLRAGQGKPIVLVHSLNGTVAEYWPIVKALRTRRPVWGFHARGVDGVLQPHERVEDMAAEYVERLRAAQPSGPYALCGYSLGSLVAFEMAQQLMHGGEVVDPLCLLDPHVNQDLPWITRIRYRCAHGWRMLSRLPATQIPGYLLSRLSDVGNLRGELPAQLSMQPVGVELTPQHLRVRQALWTALRSYRPRAYAGQAVLVRTEVPLSGFFDSMSVWRKVVGGGLEIAQVPGEHFELVTRNAQRVAAVIDEALAG